MIRFREHSHIGSQHMSISCHNWIWNLIVGFEECNERLILVNYSHNQIVGLREMCSQSLVKVSQTRSNLIDGLETTRLCEIWFSGKVFTGLLGIGVVFRKC